MSTRKYLIVNADDFGQSSGVNRGIIEAHERGIVTSASLMVRWPAAAEAAAYGRRSPGLALGWHFDLGEWVFRAGQWMALYQVAALDDPAAIRDQARGQLATFRRLAGKDPTHIDSHQHVHLREPVLSVLAEVARTLGVPLRHDGPAIRYCGGFYGQTAAGQPLPDAIGVAALIDMVRQLPPGWTELGCHPGRGRDLETMYGMEREREVETLCDPAVRAALADSGVELRSFKDRP
jgi:predicted glycoside hydrolase/deacetylase ChbG (UPF0249 family)